MISLLLRIIDKEYFSQAQSKAFKDKFLGAYKNTEKEEKGPLQRRALFKKMARVPASLPRSVLFILKKD